MPLRLASEGRCAASWITSGTVSGEDRPEVLFSAFAYFEVVKKRVAGFACSNEFKTRVRHQIGVNHAFELPYRP